MIGCGKSGQLSRTRRIRPDPEGQRLGRGTNTDTAPGGRRSRHDSAGAGDPAGTVPAGRRPGPAGGGRRVRGRDGGRPGPAIHRAPRPVVAVGGDPLAGRAADPRGPGAELPGRPVGRDGGGGHPGRPATVAPAHLDRHIPGAGRSLRFRRLPADQAPRGAAAAAASPGLGRLRLVPVRPRHHHPRRRPGPGCRPEPPRPPQAAAGRRGDRHRPDDVLPDLPARPLAERYLRERTDRLGDRARPLVPVHPGPPPRAANTLG